MKISIRTRRALYTKTFLNVFDSLRDPVGKSAVVSRIERAKTGNFGDCEAIEEGIYEFRIDSGPGYRVYFGIRGDELIVLVILGTKRTQRKDTRLAVKLWKLLKEEEL